MAGVYSVDELTAPVVLVDDAGHQIGTAPKLAVHRQGLKHLAISVIVANRQGQILMQQRALGKYHSGGLWTNTCCSHPYPGEEVGVAAARRLTEEMGFSCDLAPIFATSYRAELANSLIENEFVHVFGGVFDGKPQPEPSEVMAWRWQSLDEIERDPKSEPEAYSVWFNIYFNTFGRTLAQLTAGGAARRA